MSKKLYIDLEKCSECKSCDIDCDYFYHPSNSGVSSLRELATFTIVCRKCEDPACVRSCPKDALEKQKDGTIKRYNMRCISCKSCTIACPFGTIYPELVPYAFARCDLCLEKLKNGDPKCVESCKEEGIKYIDIEADPLKDLYAIGDNIVVHTKVWNRLEVTK